MAIHGNQIFTKSLTNGSLTISEGDGIALVSILCTSETGGTVTGNGQVAGVSSGAMNIAQNTAVTVGTISGFPLDSLVVTAPADCTLEITAVFG